MVDIRSFSEFDVAAREVLKFLHHRLGFNLWMVTRTEGNDWIALQVEDHGYNVKPGSVFSWADSFCSQMVLGLGPSIAPCSADIPAYATAPIGRQLTIGAYIGVPLKRQDGSLFGTMCAIDPTTQPHSITAELPLIEMLGGLLCTVLELELKAAEQIRQIERAQAEALTDSLTSLYNRRGWDQLLAAEETRCQRYGHPACVVAIDLDGLKQINDTQGHGKGDELICRAGRAIRKVLRQQDVLARIGGDEFVVLGVECDALSAKNLIERIYASLSAVQVEASVGLAMRDPRQGLCHAVEQADQAMYACKQTRKTKC
uniref:Diguanylate cyclase with GAF sensor n=1 Tax=Cyanothece sp. (strain PCC 7425 / ATCC 29141) TaxID=395961 RepID=B8HS15_CYAP4